MAILVPTRISERRGAVLLQRAGRTCSWLSLIVSPIPLAHIVSPLSFARVIVVNAVPLSGCRRGFFGRLHGFFWEAYRGPLGGMLSPPGAWNTKCLTQLACYGAVSPSRPAAADVSIFGPRLSACPNCAQFVRAHADVFGAKVFIVKQSSFKESV